MHAPKVHNMMQMKIEMNSTGNIIPNVLAPKFYPEYTNLLYQISYFLVFNSATNGAQVLQSLFTRTTSKFMDTKCLPA